MIRLVQASSQVRVKPADQPIVLWLVHPLTEPCSGQVLALVEASLAGHADGVLLVVPAGRKHLTRVNLTVSKQSVKHGLSSRMRNQSGRSQRWDRLPD